MTSTEIEKLLTDAFPDALVKIEDLRGDGDHYAAFIESNQFKGLTKIKQHQMVYKALGEKMGNELHALALTTSVPKNGE